MNECLEIDVQGNSWQGSLEFDTLSGWDIEIESGHEVKAVAVEETDGAAVVACSGIVPEGRHFDWEQEIEVTSTDFVFVYVGPELDDLLRTEAWFRDDGWFWDEGW